MTDTSEDVSPALIWRRIGEAGKLLDLAPPQVCSIAGLSNRQVEMLRAETYVPSLPRLTALADKTGLPIEFFLSESEPTVFPAKFRSGTPRSLEEEDLEVFWQRREILRLGTLADFLVDALPDAQAKAMMRVRRAAQKAPRPSRIILSELGIRPGGAPIGPRLESALDRLGVVRIHYPFYTRAKIAGLSWWQRGHLPLLTTGASLSRHRGFFTTAHELAHLLLHLDSDEEASGYRCRPAPSIENSNHPKEEREADRIAAELLMPDELRDEARQRVSARGPLRASAELSADWDLSRQTIALRLESWELADRDDIRGLFAPRTGFAPAKVRPPEDRFGSPDRTKEFVRKIYEAGATARYVAWLTKIPLEDVLCFLGRATPEGVAG